jgi:hypothetical protein
MVHGHVGVIGVNDIQCIHAFAAEFVATEKPASIVPTSTFRNRQCALQKSDKTHRTSSCSDSLKNSSSRNGPILLSRRSLVQIYKAVRVAARALDMAERTEIVAC